MNDNYENYFCNFLHGGFGKTNTPLVKKLHFFENEKIKYYEISDVNYLSIKNTILSILWRCSVSNSIPNFNLGDKHNEILRKIIHNKEITDESDYTIQTYSLCELKDKIPFDPIGLMIEPFKLKKDGAFYYYFLTNGLLFVITVSSHKRVIDPDFYMSKNNIMRIIILTDNELPFIQKLLGLR